MASTHFSVFRAGENRTKISGAFLNPPLHWRGNILKKTITVSNQKGRNTQRQGESTFCL
jgi:hypothetical protein